MSSRKRSYRHRVRCGECYKEIDSDYKDNHSRLVHNNKKIKCIPFESTDSFQSKISGFFLKSSTTVEHSTTLSGTSQSNDSEDLEEQYDKEQYEQPISEVQALPMTMPSECFQPPPFDVKETDVNMLRENDQGNNNTALELPANLLLPMPIPLDDVRVTDEISFYDKQPETAERPTVLSESLKGTSSISQGPKQPILNEYPARKFGNETFARRFQPEWYKKYPWLSYEVDKDECVCFACTEFGNDSAFVYRNWKKISKLAKHGTSENHVKAMTRWLEFKAMEKKKTSILEQLISVHQD